MIFWKLTLITVNISLHYMSEGVHKRIQPDIAREIEEYPGGSFSEKLVKWKNDVNTLSYEDVKEAVREALPAGIFR